MAYGLRSYSGKARATTLAASLTESATTFQVTDASTWTEGPGYTFPLGHSGYFVVSVDYGTSTEEKILCSAVNTSTGVVTVVTRGYDGLTPAGTGPGNAHSANATVIPVFSAAEAIEVNYAVSETVGTVTTAGDMLVAAGANNLTRLGIGSDGSILTAASGNVGWSSVGTNNYILSSTGSGIQWVNNTNPSLVGYRSATLPATSLAASTWTSIPLDTAGTSTGVSGELVTLNTTQGRFTVSKAGLYQINGTVTIAGGSSATYVGARVQINPNSNGQVYNGAFGYSSSASGGSSSTSATVLLAAGDKIEVQAYTPVAATFTNYAAGPPAIYYNYASVTYVGRGN